MKYIAVHIDPNYSNSYSKRWIEIINNTEGYCAKKVNLKAADAITQVRGCIGVMWHYRHTPQDKQIAAKVLPAIEEILGIPVWPNYKTRWHFDEKVAQHYLFEAMEISAVKSWVFWNYDDAIDFMKNTQEYPLVFKLSVGAGAANIFKIDSMEEGISKLNRMFHEGIFPYTENEFKTKSMNGESNIIPTRRRLSQAIKFFIYNKIPDLPPYYQLQKDYIYFQKFMEGNSHDIRITIIGNRAFGFIRYNRPDDFRASGSGAINFAKNLIPLQAVKIAFQLSDKAGFQSMAYDFLIDEEGEPAINEISYCYVNKAVKGCSGYWDRDLRWHDGNIWPEQAQVEDFIALIEKTERT